MGQHRQYPTQLFTVRLWQEPLGNGQSEWRGKVQHVASGEVRYFRTWSVLRAFLEAPVPGREPQRLSEEGEALPGE